MKGEIKRDIDEQERGKEDVTANTNETACSSPQMNEKDRAERQKMEQEHTPDSNTSVDRRRRHRNPKDHHTQDY